MAFVDDSKSYVTAAGGARVEDYFALLKPRVMSLVVFTAIIGLLLAPGGINPVVGVIAILCIAIGAGGSGALNMWYDADIDRVMSRTANRPIPAGRVRREEALTLGLICSGFSVMILGLATNWVAAALLAFTIFFYAVVYTMWLKRSTPQNIVIGGAAGAVPPLVGYAAASGSLGLPALWLFLIVFLWTPPHFWALALMIKDHYAAANVPMLPGTRGDAETTRQIVLYSVALVAFTLVVGIWLGPLYTVAAAGLGAYFLFLAHRLRADASRRNAVLLFHYSLAYLALLFVAAAIDPLVV